jgi:hypothetical protein
MQNLLDIPIFNPIGATLVSTDLSVPIMKMKCQ